MLSILSLEEDLTFLDKVSVHTSMDVVNEDKIILIRNDKDIVKARQCGRELAASLGFELTDLTLIATTISELARNILSYAKHGEIDLKKTENESSFGITIVARDKGPGITDVDRVLRSGYSTSGNLGLGLPGVRKLMDDFKVETRDGQGTIISVTKWKR